MSRTAVAKEPQEIYDDLSQNEQDTFDRIAATGWKPVPAGRGWKAEKEGQDDIGPFPTLSELETAIGPDADVSVEENDDSLLDEPSDLHEGKVIKIPADSNGNRFFEGMEPVVDSEIASAAGKYHSIKTDRVNLLNKETQAKEELVDLCHRKRHLFKADPENTNAKIYKCGDLVIRMENEVKEKISTSIEAK